MTYVSNIVNGLVKILDERDNLNGEIINIGSSQEMSVLDSAKLIVELCNSKSKIKHISQQEAFGNYKEIKRRRANTKKAFKLLGWKCKDDFTDKLKEVIKCLRDK